MRSDNPAAQPCANIDKGPDHMWIRRADNTATCHNCGVTLTKEQVREAFPVPTQVNKKLGGTGSGPAPLKEDAGTDADAD